MDLVRETRAFPLLEKRRSLKIGSTIDEEGEKAFGQASTANVDLFSWMTEDILRVDLELASQPKSRRDGELKRDLFGKRDLKSPP